MILEATLKSQNVKKLPQKHQGTKAHKNENQDISFGEI